MDPFAALSAAKTTATGVGLRVLDQPNLQPECKDEAEFSAIVSTYYKNVREDLADDIDFLQWVTELPATKTFIDAVNTLRTAAQHSGNERAQQFWNSFVSTNGDWKSCGSVLGTMYAASLSELASVAVAVLRSADARREWRQRTELDVTVIFSGVRSDLAKHFTPANEARMIRQIEIRLRNQGTNGPRKRVIQDYCVQQILSSQSPLPVEYFEILDRLGLIGDAGAEGALQVAYSVASIATDLSGEAFLNRVEATWRTAAQY